MKVCVDTSILLDVLKDEFGNFQDMLYLALERKEILLAPSVVFAELMPQFQRKCQAAERISGGTQYCHKATGHRRSHCRVQGMDEISEAKNKRDMSPMRWKTEPQRTFPIRLLYWRLRRHEL